MSLTNKRSHGRNARAPVSQQIWRVLLIANVIVAFTLIRTAPVSETEGGWFFRVAILLGQTATVVIFSMNTPFMGRLTNWLPGAVTLFCWWALERMLPLNTTELLWWAALLIMQTNAIIFAKRRLASEAVVRKPSIETLLRWTTLAAIGFALFGFQNRSEWFRFTTLDYQTAIVMAALGVVSGVLGIAAEWTANSSRWVNAARRSISLAAGVLAAAYGFQFLLAKTGRFVWPTDLLILQSVYVTFVVSFCWLERRVPLLVDRKFG